MRKLRTSDLARITGIHPNTVRFYERIGLLSPVPRDPNGYRAFDDRHILQARVCRCIYPYGWLGRKARVLTNLLTDALVQGRYAEAQIHAESYLTHLVGEWDSAKMTSEILDRWSQRVPIDESDTMLNRRETAAFIGVTEEVLRSWERSGLIQVPRVGPNRARVYGAPEIERLRIIHLLRQSSYSVNAIFSSLQQYDKGNSKGVIRALNSPDPDEDATWIYVGDRWIASLEAGMEGAKQILVLLQENPPS
jgi:DNA-binding transcriptional MerR regulator